MENKLAKASIKQIANSAIGHKELFHSGKKIQASKVPDIRFGLDKEVFVITAKKLNGQFTTVKIFSNGDITERHKGEKHAVKMPNQHSNFADSLASHIGSKLIKMLHDAQPELTQYPIHYGDDGVCLCGLNLGFHS